MRARAHRYPINESAQEASDIASKDQIDKKQIKIELVLRAALLLNILNKNDFC